MSHELLITIVTTLISAVLGLFGGGTAILISLFPAELTGVRDNHQRLAKIWGLLLFDTKRINVLCQNHIRAVQEAFQHSSTSNQLSLLTFVRVPTFAWHAALANGDFIAQVSQEILNKLTEGYLAVDTLNDTLEHHARFTTTSRALTSFSNDITNFYKVISQNCLAINDHFQSLQQQIAEQEKINIDKAKLHHKRLEILKWFGVILFVIVFLSLILLIILIWKSLN